MKPKPKCYKWPLLISKEVYMFMTSMDGVGSANELFKVGWHNPSETIFSQKVGWFKRKSDVADRLCWLIDWYHAAKTNTPCAFPGAAQNCGLC